MRCTTLSCLVFGLAMVGLCAASEPDELRERAQVLQKKAAILADEGKNDVAEKLLREAKELLTVAEKMAAETKGRGAKETFKGGKEPVRDDEHRMRHLKEGLQELRAMERKMAESKAPEQELAGVREKIAAVERELKQSRTGERRDARPELREHGEKLEMAMKRIHHLRVAAENLKAAEAHDLAGQIMEKAAAIEREVQDARKRMAVERREAHGEEHGPQMVRELRMEIERLRAEVNELRQKLEKR